MFLWILIWNKLIRLNCKSNPSYNSLMISVPPPAPTPRHGILHSLQFTADARCCAKRKVWLSFSFFTFHLFSCPPRLRLIHFHSSRFCCARHSSSLARWCWRSVLRHGPNSSTSAKAKNWIEVAEVDGNSVEFEIYIQLQSSDSIWCFSPAYPHSNSERERKLLFPLFLLLCPLPSELLPAPCSAALSRLKIAARY